MNVLKHKVLIYTALVGICLTTPAVEAFLSPKQQGKIRNEIKKRYESPDSEYIYYSKWYCSALGSFSLCIGTLATLVGFFDSHASAGDRILVTVGGNFMVSSGIFILQRCLSGTPAIVMNDAGMRSRDHGLMLWDEIDYIKFDLSTFDATMDIGLNDGTTIYIDGSFLGTNRNKILRKIERYRTVDQFGRGVFGLRSS